MPIPIPILILLFILIIAYGVLTKKYDNVNKTPQDILSSQQNMLWLLDALEKHDITCKINNKGLIGITPRGFEKLTGKKLNNIANGILIAKSGDWPYIEIAGNPSVSVEATSPSADIVITAWYGGSWKLTGPWIKPVERFIEELLEAINIKEEAKRQLADRTLQDVQDNWYVHYYR